MATRASADAGDLQHHGVLTFLLAAVPKMLYSHDFPVCTRTANFEGDEC